jgi:hypothetical protein
MRPAAYLNNLFHCLFPFLILLFQLRKWLAVGAVRASVVATTVHGVVTSSKFSRTLCSVWSIKTDYYITSRDRADVFITYLTVSSSQSVSCTPRRRSFPPLLWLKCGFFFLRWKKWSQCSALLYIIVKVMTLVGITMVSSTPNYRTTETKFAAFWRFQRNRKNFRLMVTNAKCSVTVTYFLSSV